MSSPPSYVSVLNSSGSGGETSQPARIRPSQQHSSQSLVKTGAFANYEEYRQARQSARWKMAQVGLLVVGGITAGILAVVCPPVFAAGVALAAGGGSAVISVIKNLFSLTSDLAENPSFLSSFKRKVKRTANAFSDWTRTKTEPLRKNSRYEPHVAFVDKLSETMSQFADRIQDKDYQGGMEEALAFERQTLQMVEDHLLAHGRDTDRQRIFTTQEFLRKYNKYLSHLPEDLDRIGEVDRLRLQHIVEQARNSGIPQLVEWSNHPDNLAENLAQLQLQSHAST